MMAMCQGLRRVQAGLFFITWYKFLGADELLPIASFSLILAFLCLLASQLSPRKAGWISAAVYMGNLLLVFRADQQALLPDMVKHRLLVWTAVFTGSVIHQVCCSSVLPKWMLLLSSELHAWAHWSVMRRLHEPVSEMVLAQIMNVALPALVLRLCWAPPAAPPCFKSVDSTSKSVDSTSESVDNLADQHGEGCAFLPNATTATTKSQDDPPRTTAQSSSTPITCMTSDGMSMTSCNPPRIYQSVFAKRTVVCIKIATHHHPMNLLPLSLDNLTRAMVRSQTSRHIVLGACVRYGCILISLDTRNLLPASTPCESVDDILRCAHQLFPDLVSLLGLNAKDDHASLLPGQYLSLQLGRHLVFASKTLCGQEWIFTVRPASSTLTPTSTLPRLCLARARPAMPHPVESKSLVVHAAAFEAQLQCDAATGYFVVVGSRPDQMRGPTCPTSNSGSHEGFQKPHLQLWVHCQGQYLHTSIQPASDVSPISKAVRAVVHLPSNVLARHHQPDGPVARLQLLTAELWDGDMLLSSTPILMDVKAHLHPALAPSSFGWWGASSTHVSGMVQEVRAIANAALAAGCDSDLMHSHDAFVSDLSAWLLIMQQAAPGTCCDVYAITDEQSYDKLEVGRVLGDSLLGYTVACKLHSTQALVRSQHSKVLASFKQHAAACIAPDACIAPTTHSDMADSTAIHMWHWFQHMLLCAVCMRRCDVCDQVYYTRLRTHLRQAILCSGLLLAGALLTAGQAYDIRNPVIWFAYGWAGAHLLSTVCVLLSPDVGVGSTSCLHWYMCCGGAQVVAWMVHTSIEIGLWTGRLHPSPNHNRPANLAPFYASHTLFSLLNEQVHTWGRWPGWLVRAAVMVEVALHTHIWWSCPGLPVWLHIGYPAGVLVLPWVLDWHWRKLLMPVNKPLPSHSNKATSHHVHQD